ALSDFTWGWQPHGLEGALRLDSDLALDGNLAWRTAVARQDYAGALTLGGSLDSLTLEHQLTAPQTVVSSAMVEPGIFAGQTLRFDLRTDAETINLATWGVEGAIVSDIALVASGTPEDAELNLSLSAIYPELPQTLATLAVRWQNDQVLIDGLQLSNPELDFNVTGSLEPTPLQADISWRLDRLDPGERFPSVQLVGVTGSGTVQVQQEGESFLTQAEITNLGGTLNGLPLTIQGTAALRDALPEELNVSARSGDNQIEVTGGITDVLDLRWDLQAPQLNQLWTALRGTVA